MKSRTQLVALTFALALIVAPGIASAAVVSVTSADLNYGISGSNSNSFALDFTGDPNWTAGSQRSDNGNIDANNRRAGRLFVEFQLTSALIAEAAVPGATVSLTFNVDSIGGGVSPNPYTDGLDLRYLGTNAANRTASTLWGTAPVGGVDQADILVTAGPTGSHTVLLTNANVLSQIAAASAGQFIAFGMSNSVGVVGGQAVGSSLAQTYGFQMNHTLTNYALTINTIPTPAALPAGFTLLALAAARRRR